MYLLLSTTLDSWFHLELMYVLPFRTTPFILYLKSLNPNFGKVLLLQQYLFHIIQCIYVVSKARVHPSGWFSVNSPVNNQTKHRILNIIMYFLLYINMYILSFFKFYLIIIKMNKWFHLNPYIYNSFIITNGFYRQIYLNYRLLFSLSSHYYFT